MKEPEESNKSEECLLCNQEERDDLEVSHDLEMSIINKIIYLLPIIFIICVVPLFVYGKVIELTPVEADFWKGGTSHVDFFSYYKSNFLRLASGVALVFFAYLYLSHKIVIRDYKKYYIPMIVYVGFVLLSTIFSNNITVALNGFIEMYQGMAILLCYILLTFIVMNMVQDERDAKILIYAMVVLVVLMGVLGLSQYFGFDFFQSDLGRSIITPKELEGVDLKFSHSKNRIYATMYNTNFVGSFGALMIPMTVMLYLSTSQKKKELVFLISSALAYTTWLGCYSRAGYLSIITTSIMAFVLFRNIFKNNVKKIMVLAVIYIAIAIVFNVSSKGGIAGQFVKLSPITEAEKIRKVEEEQEVRFESISVKDNTFTVKTDTEEITVVVNNYHLTFQDGEGNQLDTIMDSENNITFLDAPYEKYIFTKLEDSPIIKVKLYDRPMNLCILEDDTVKVVSFNYKLTDPEVAPRFKLFDYRETFASHRGYIWSRSIPMLKDTLLLGYGPDNYCFMFPQEDYVGRFNTGRGMTHSIVDKPHNMYLQTALNTGVISLIALISMWGIYIVDSIKLYGFKKISSYTEYMGVAAFLAITAYLTAGLFNDYVVSVAPLFWIILGLGIGINQTVRIDKLKNQC